MPSSPKRPSTQVSDGRGGARTRPASRSPPSWPSRTASRRSLKARREVVRGKPETFNRPDYSFKLEREAAPDGAPPEALEAQEPSGHERVSITPRRRGAPLDLVVAEAMILANSTWGAWLAEHGVPGIYRSQASMAPGIKVRMGVKPLPHAGMGVPQYAWATSPLRRCVDLVNQWQIIAVARQGRTAALVAPFKPRDAALFALISAFDAAHAAYNDFQNGIERFWTLRWLEQNGVSELEATLIKPGVARAETLPLVFALPGTDHLARGTRVRARIAGMDLLTLDLHATLAAALAVPPRPPRRRRRGRGRGRRRCRAGGRAAAPGHRRRRGRGAGAGRSPA